MGLVIEDRLGQVTTITGTGAYLTGALITAMKSLDASLAVNDYFYGYVEAVDANGNPTGDWECGKYTKTAANTFARTEIHSSSNGNAAVNWAAGTKHIKLALTAYQLRYVDPNASGGVVTPPPPPSSNPTPFGRNPTLYGALTFRDEFDGTAVNSSKWPMQRLWYEAGSYANRGNIDVSGGNMRLWAKPWASSSDPTTRYPNEGGSYKNHNATICTDGVFYQRYGYFEAKIKMPRGKGPFTAFWLYGHADQAGNEISDRPEVDIVECYSSGGVDTAWSTSDNRPINHVCTVWGGNEANPPIGYRKGNDVGAWNIDLSADAHIYGLHWDSAGWQFTFDGSDFGTKILGSITHPLYMILDYWMGGESGYANDPAGTLIESAANSMEVHYVRAWALADGSTFTRGTAVEPGGGSGGGTTPVIDGTVDFYGNSTIFGWNPALNGTPSEGQAVATPIPAAFNARTPTSTGVNRGVNGADANDALNGTDGIPWADWGTHINSTTAKYAIIQYREKDTTANLTTNLTTIVNQAKAAGKVVFILTEIPSLNGGALTHAQIAATQRQVAATLGVHVLDVNQYMVDYMAANGLAIVDVCPDTQHPSQLYYLQIGQWVKDEFVRKLAQTVTQATTPLPIPSNTVLLSTYGGVPGATGETIFNAWQSAIAAIKALGGGTLKIGAGTYAMGALDPADEVFHADALSNVLIDARGAVFTCSTAAATIASLFTFKNPNNVTLWGAKGMDSGYSATSGSNDRGTYLCMAYATTLCRHFKMMDCETDGAIGYFRSQNVGAGAYMIENVDIRGTAKNTYYGASFDNVGRGANVDLICDNVRRAVIAYHPQDATFKIVGTHGSAALGSNGYVSIIRTDTGRDPDNLTIDVSLTGTTNHTALVHFYHQFGSNTNTANAGWIQNINAKVTLNNLANTGPLSLYRFDHETPSGTVVATTVRGWKSMVLDAAITGTFSGTRINSLTTSTVAGNAVGVKPGLLTSMSGLPSYFIPA